MAALGTAQQAEIRRDVERSGEPIDYTKPQINAAAQAVEDVLTSAALKTQVNTTINTATAPLVLAAAQKRAVVVAILRKLAERWT